MIRRAAIRLGLAVGVLSLAGTAWGVTDEKAEAGGIQQAKQEFDTIKDTVKSISGTDARKALPRINGIDAPAIAPLMDAPATRKPNSLDEKKARRNQNWLVEAMMKEPTDQRDPTKRKADQGESLDEDENLDPMERLLVEQLRGDEAKKAQAAAEELRAQEELKNAVVNPLNDFMAAWISTRDHDLLLGNQPAVKTEPSFDDVRLQTMASAHENRLLSFNRAGPETVRAENPYLSLPEVGLREERPVVTVPGLGSTQTFTQPAITTPLPPEPSAESKRGKEALPPILTKPEEDARYFPQLKRF